MKDDLIVSGYVSLSLVSTNQDSFFYSLCTCLTYFDLQVQRSVISEQCASKLLISNSHPREYSRGAQNLVVHSSGNFYVDASALLNQCTGF
jgi:hypothetical protein